MITPQHTDRARARRRGARVLAALLGLALLLPVGVAATTAAWHDSAAFAGTASAAGTWPTPVPPPVVACEMFQYDEAAPYRVDLNTSLGPCEATGSVIQSWWTGESGNSPRAVRLGFGVEHELISSDETYAHLTFDLQRALATVAPDAQLAAPLDGWRWSTTGFTGHYPLNAESVIGCDMPYTVEAVTPRNYHGTAQSGLGTAQLDEQRTNWGQYQC
ncbi:hypothetical protein ACFUMH_02135 [Cellulomonas sp. NPDC057328]|uniref:hypothetical protein n=1 Tax=Cellulomonas sp. NPDC057328 TaxID=3346101 RepID=UPI00363C6CD9